MRAQDFITKHTEQGVAEGSIRYGELNSDNVNLIIDKARDKTDGVYNFRGIMFRVKNGGVTHWAVDGEILQAMGRFNTQVGSYDPRRNDQARAMLKNITESLQLDEGLGDWIEKKMDQLLNPYNNHNYSNRPDAVASAVKAAPVNLPDDVAEQLVAEFLKQKDHAAALERAARAQGTTVDKIRPYLQYFVGNFVDRWRRIPARDKQQFWKDLALSVFRLIVFILQAMAKGKR